MDITNTLIKEITRLSEIWYSLIRQDHHKDRDCHWHIETVWSYGQAPTYFVRHYGYILNDISEPYESYEASLRGLVKILQTSIKDTENSLEEETTGVLK